MVHLKRFSPQERFRGKLSTTVDFPVSGLDLSPYSAGQTNCRYAGEGEGDGAYVACAWVDIAVRNWGDLIHTARVTILVLGAPLRSCLLYLTHLTHHCLLIT